MRGNDTAVPVSILMLSLMAFGQAAAPQTNQLGPYGPWLANDILGDGPARFSFRTGQWKDVETWRRAARKRVLECIAPVNLGGRPEVTVTGRTSYDGVDIEFLTWQLPMGPKTEAVFLKPAGVRGPLPAILALHDHGGNKFVGWRKIVRTDSTPWPIQEKHQAMYYGGVAWANEIAKRGYAVLVHDTFPFGSRRVMVRDVPEQIREGGVDPAPEDLAGIAKYNKFAADHENLMEKSLLSAGTTWPGVYLVEDQRALDVLSSRAEVDATRIGCAGLSGGGMRTIFLGGMDDRIKVAVAVGFTTTWRDFLLNKSFTHTWMTFVPLLPKDLDFPEILALRAPAPTMVLNSREDGLYTLPEMQRADAMIADTFKRANAADRYKSIYYDGGHKFDRKMQADAFDWFDRFLKTPSVQH
jgi:dienelactone hydrolase